MRGREGCKNGAGEEKQERERERDKGGRREGKGGRGKRTERRQEKNRKVRRHQGVLATTHLSIFGGILILPEGRLLLGGLQLIRELVTGVCDGGDA